MKSEWVALKLQSFVTMAARYADISRGTQIASWRAKAEEKAKVAPRLTQVSIFLKTICWLIVYQVVIVCYSQFWLSWSFMIHDPWESLGKPIGFLSSPQDGGDGANHTGAGL